MKACGRSALCTSMQAQTETKSKASFGNRNDHGRKDKSDGLDQQFTKLKKDISLALREISNLKNQLHKAKENIAKERFQEQEV
jgi:hypothetical protein